MTRPAAVVLAVLAVSCAVRPIALPSGTGSPAADGSQALAEATAACRAVSSISGELNVTGSAGGRRLRARLLAGLAEPASARIEAPAPFGAPVFILVANGDDATLLLSRDDRVLEHGRSDAVLEALTGVPLDPADLRATLTGCPPAEAEIRTDATRSFGDDWRMIPVGSASIYLHRDSAGPWQPVAVVHADASGSRWRAEYRNFHNGLPQSVRLTSADPARFDLRLTLGDVDIGVPLDADVFRITIPRSATPITLEELRRSGPLGESDGP